ncbi:MAG: polymer-forming cytoskeletal protein [Gemmatimonadota bacterium]
MTLRGRLSSPCGMILPVVLFLTLALGGAATSILVLARAERVVESAALRYLGDRVLSEAALARLPGDGGFSPGGSSPAATPTIEPLATDYILGRAGSRVGGPRHHALLWRLNPDSIAATLPGALEFGSAAPSGTIEAMGPECPGGSETRALIRPRPPPFPGADPPLFEGPRLGPLGLDRLLDVATVTLATAGTLPEGESVEIVRVLPGVAVVAGEGRGMILSEGDLTIRGTAHVRGIVMAAGTIEVGGEALVEGVLLAGGSVRVTDHGRVTGCRGLAAIALSHPRLSGTHAVSGGERLGRF